MALLSRLFPASRSDRSASRIPGRRRPKARSRATPVAARALSLVAEPLEPRAMLAVTATLVGGDLVIAYNEPGDLMADIESDGTIYTVSGTGLAATKFNVANVTGVISVTDKAAVFGQQFKVNAGTPLANALQVNANVESTSLLGGITTARPGDVSIGSAAISLASDISTAATNANVEFANPVTLAKNTTINAGPGAITFKGTVDGKFTLAANSTGATTFGGVVGGITPLVSLATNPGGTASLWSVTTTGTQTYGDGTVTLNGTYTTNDATFTVSKNTTLAGNTVVSTGTGNLAFNGTVDGAYRLTVADANDVYFSGKVGSNDPLAGITLQKANSVSSEDTISLDGTPALAASGITIDAGVNKVSLTKAGSTIQNFSANGVWFKGGSTDSTISGFTIKANGGDGVRLDAGGYSGTTISENLIHDNDGNGVRLTAATGPVSIADNLKIDLNSLNGVYAENSATVTITGNSIVGNTFHGVSVGGGSGVIHDNAIEDNGGNGVMLAGGYDVTDNLIELNDLNGIQVATGLTNLDITGNSVTGNDLDGIVFDAGGVTGFEVSGNAIYANKSDGIKVDAGTYTGTAIQSNEIYQNTANGIFLNANSGTIGGLLVGAGTTGAAALGNKIYQNTEDGILVGTGTYTGTVIGGHNEITLNTQNGIELAAGGATNLLITSNKIGTLAAGGGATDRGNVLDGIQVNAGGYAGTSIEGNWIAYNDVDGIHLAAAGSAITGLSITGNSIYTNDSDGIQADNGDYTSTKIRLQNLIFNNVFEGIYLAASGDSLTNLTIGGDKTAIPTSEGNDIRTNKSDGIQADAGSYAGTVIQGNDLYENSENGIFLNATADLAGLLIGGAQVKYGNEIYGNFESGVVVTGSSGGTTKFTGTKLLSNEIRTSDAYGVSLTDAKAPAEADGLLIGLNTVTANVAGGIALDTSTGHRIIGNTVTGSTAPSAVDGISLADRSDANLVYSNVVNANGGNGIVVDSSDGLEVGGVIGGFTTTAGGTVLTLAGDQTALILPGMQVGLAPPVLDPPLVLLRTVVAVSLVGGSTQVTVSAPMDLTSTAGTLGGSNTADGNGGDGIVAENSFPALIVGNVATGNAGAGIAVSGGGGTIAGNVAAGNGSGIALGGGYGVSSNNVYSNAGDGIQVASGLTDLPINNNWIYDNGSNGIYFTGGVTGFSVFRNDIGQAPDNTPAGNGASGVRFDAGTYTGTLLFDNKETTGVEGGAIAYNTLDGIFLNAASTPGGAITGLTIGGTTDDGNSIHGNGANGILVSAGDYTGTVIQGNEIDDNTADGIHLAGSAGLISLGRLVITAPGLTGTPLTTSAAAELFLPGVTSSSIQAIDAAGYPGASLGFVSLDASVAGTPPTTVSGAGGIGGISDPGLAYQAAAQTAFETNPLLPGTNGRAGTAAYDAASSGTLPNGGGQDGFMFYDFLVSGGAGVLNLLIVDNLVASNGSDGIEAAVGDHMGTAITGNELRGNGNPATHVGNGILVEGSNLTIGWTAEAGEPNTVGNTITGNAANGIEIRGAAAQNNTILANAISLNGYGASGVVVGEGIALVDGGNGALPSPRILGAVADKGSGTVRVQVVVPAAGGYYVQLFANTAADERGLVPVDVNGFEGRTYVGDSPAQAGSTVTNVKPLIAGVLIAGNTVNVIEMPAARVPAGSWITATATKVDSTTLSALNTSSFSEAVQLPSASVLAVGSDGPAVWVPHYNYQALSGNVLRLGGLTVTEVNRLVAMRGRQIFISANGRSEVATATVANVRRLGGRAVNIVLRNITSPEGSLAGTAGRLEPGPLTLPTARLYDAATGEVVLDVGAEAIAASLEAAGVAPAAADAFVSRFQGGLRVASGDVDGDGFADLMTAPGAAPAIPAATFGNATRIITIYSGNPAAAWESASLDVSAAFPGYSGGFQVTLGDVLPDAAGDGNGVLELIVAGTNKVAVYELTVPERGAAPEIAATPAAEWAIGPRFRITGLAAGDFSAAASDEVVVATAAPAGTVVRTFSVVGGSFAAQSTFQARSYVEGGPQRRLRDVFANGASLAVGDIDGAVDGKPELVLAAAAQGLANFRVLANALVAGGTQPAIDTALAVGNGFTRQSRSQYAMVNGRRVWQPAGGPDYFAGMSRLTNAFALGINAPLSVAVVNATGATAAGQVFAALGPQNATRNEVRRLFWRNLTSNWDSAGGFAVVPSGQNRFPLGGGLLLG